jgi:hypothetical protein
MKATEWAFHDAAHVVMNAIASISVVMSGSGVSAREWKLAKVGEHHHILREVRRYNIYRLATQLDSRARMSEAPEFNLPSYCWRKLLMATTSMVDALRV